MDASVAFVRRQGFGHFKGARGVHVGSDDGHTMVYLFGVGEFEFSDKIDLMSKISLKPVSKDIFFPKSLSTASKKLG